MSKNPIMNTFVDSKYILIFYFWTFIFSLCHPLNSKLKPSLTTVKTTRKKTTTKRWPQGRRPQQRKPQKRKPQQWWPQGRKSWQKSFFFFFSFFLLRVHDDKELQELNVPPLKRLSSCITVILSPFLCLFMKRKNKSPWFIPGTEPCTIACCWADEVCIVYWPS